MSSFGSSLINKGKKVVPKAAARRRPAGTASSLAVQSDGGSVSARSSIEPSQTPQPELLGRGSVPPPGLPTPEISQVTTEPLRSEKSGPTLHLGAEPRDADRSHQETHESRAQPEPTNTLITVRENSIPLIATDSSRIRGGSPIVQLSGTAKRRRLDPSDLLVRSTSPQASTKIARPVDDDEIPVIQVSKTPPRSLSKPSRTAFAAKAKRATKDGLVEYETPVAAQAEPSASETRQRASRPAVAPLLMATMPSSKPRAKGTRRNQWQITTVVDLAAARARDGIYDTERNGNIIAEQDDLNNGDGPRLRKIRKDKGVKRGPMVDVQNDEDEEQPPSRTNGSRSMRTRSSQAERMDLEAAATRGRTIAPRPGSTQRVSASTEVDASTANYEEPSASGASARLRNAQKRRARQNAVQAAQSRATAADTAAEIDEAITESIEGAPSRRRGRATNPLFRVQAQEGISRQRSDSVGTDTTEFTVMTEGGTVKRKRYRRQVTPPGNETVFIAEKVTPMLSLVGRDTENRVGQRSITEMRMRNVDWKEIKAQHDDKMRQAAFLKGSRKTNNFDVIFGRNGTPALDVKGTPRSGDEEEEVDEGDELENLVAQRERRFGPSKSARFTLINGQHRLDEDSGRTRGAGEEIESQMGDYEPAEENDLKRARFNVQTFIKFKRKDPTERVYQSSRWSDEETEKFYEALRCCGVDFGSMAEWFPNRIRRSLKRKFNIEERANPIRLNETLDAHMMMLANGDDGTGWDMSSFRQNGAGHDLRDPREVEEELMKIRKEREVEIEEARKEYEAERRNQALAGIVHSDEEEEGEEEEYEEVEIEVDENEDDGLDVVAQMQREMMEKKRDKKPEVPTKGGAQQDGSEDGQEDVEEDGEDDEEGADDEPLLRDDEDGYASEEPADWDEEDDYHT